MKKRHNFKEDKELMSALNNIYEALKNVVEALDKITATISKTLTPIVEIVEADDDTPNTKNYSQDIESPTTARKPVQQGTSVTNNYDPLANQVQRNKEFREGGPVQGSTN